ncbi:MAG: hypothetical protein FWG31_08700 [Oscillospiraceae bacterium]|nr:hypothetical protein [Oscillospiraceae bacterium]
MARCTKCGRQGTFEDSLCPGCKSGVTYHYVEKPKVRPIRKKRTVKAWWGALYGPVDKKKLRRNALIVLSATVLLLLALILFRPSFGSGEDLENDGQPTDETMEGNP